MARFRPHTPILGMTADERTAQQLTLSWGVTPILIENEWSYEFRVDKAVAHAKDGEAGFRRRLLDHYGIEIGGGLGDLAGKIWRIGLMGENARIINVEALLFALRKELSR